MRLWNQVLKAMNCLSQANNSYLPFHFFKFKTCCFTLLRRKPCRCWYFTIVFAFCRCHSFNPSLCRLSPFLLPCFKAMSIVEIYPNVLMCDCNCWDGRGKGCWPCEERLEAFTVFIKYCTTRRRILLADNKPVIVQ